MIGSLGQVALHIVGYRFSPFDVYFGFGLVQEVVDITIAAKVASPGRVESGIAAALGVVEVDEAADGVLAASGGTELVGNAFEATLAVARYLGEYSLAKARTLVRKPTSLAMSHSTSTFLGKSGPPSPLVQ